MTALRWTGLFAHHSLEAAGGSGRDGRRRGWTQEARPRRHEAGLISWRLFAEKSMLSLPTKPRALANPLLSASSPPRSLLIL